MKRAGAAYVLGAEAFPQYLEQAKLVRDILQLDIEFRGLNVYDLTEDLGQFDITLFLGVLYHLKNPLLGLNALAKVTRGILVIESAILPDHEFSVSKSLDYGGPMHQLGFIENNPGVEALRNWFIPSLSCLKALVQTVGFNRIVGESVIGERAILIASRQD
jgi:tRNA (mo5U34)-methyltransferase